MHIVQLLFICSKCYYRYTNSLADMTILSVKGQVVELLSDTLPHHMTCVMSCDGEFVNKLSFRCL
jgi:hypothetical protein